MMMKLRTSKYNCNSNSSILEHNQYKMNNSDDNNDDGSSSSSSLLLRYRNSVKILRTTIRKSIVLWLLVLFFSMTNHNYMVSSSTSNQRQQQKSILVVQKNNIVGIQQQIQRGGGRNDRSSNRKSRPTQTISSTIHPSSTSSNQKKIWNNKKNDAKVTNHLVENKNGKDKASSIASTDITTTNNNNNSSSSMTINKRLKLGFYFMMWYILNIYYNIINKQLLNIIPSPLIIGTIQLGIGSVYILMLWLLCLRTAPSIRLNIYNHNNIGLSIWNVGSWHSIGQLCSMISLTAGSVSFTHIVKALEPFFSSLVSILLFKKIMPFPVYISLVPVVFGVAYACLQEKSFSLLSFNMAMISNIAFAFRAVYSKMTMTNATIISSVNLYGLVTCSSFFISILITLVTSILTNHNKNDIYGSNISTFISSWKNAISLSTSLKPITTSIVLIQMIIISGIVHYLNNEVMYMALSNIHPITLAVANTMKRIFIIISSIFVFHNPITIQAMIGSTIGISGVFIYSLIQQYYETKVNK